MSHVGLQTDFPRLHHIYEICIHLLYIFCYTLLLPQFLVRLSSIYSKEIKTLSVLHFDADMFDEDVSLCVYLIMVLSAIGIEQFEYIYSMEVACDSMRSHR